VSGTAGTVLVADDDEDVLRFVEVNLRLEGFRVATASDGESALERAGELQPDLILLDVMMPKMDGYDVCRRVREDARLRRTSVIMLTAKSLSVDKVVGLTAGADDYIVKPFDPVELVARVKTALRRVREMRSANPLTQLPGNVEVQDEVARRMELGLPFALMYADLDNFKAYNDHYGFMRGDEAIKALAACLDEAVQPHRDRDVFLGHIGGDDFVVVLAPDAAEGVAKELVASWERSVAHLYEDEDLKRGYIEVTDRRNQLRRFPVATVSIGIASTAHRPIGSHWEAAEIATEMKQFAKRESASSYAVDRRRPGNGGAA
jgi:diguanylate cyclase (GGDEF)-like protein